MAGFFSTFNVSKESDQPHTVWMELERLLAFITLQISIYVTVHLSLSSRHDTVLNSEQRNAACRPLENFSCL